MSVSDDKKIELNFQKYLIYRNKKSREDSSIGWDKFQNDFPKNNFKMINELSKIYEKKNKNTKAIRKLQSWSRYCSHWWQKNCVTIKIEMWRKRNREKIKVSTYIPIKFERRNKSYKTSEKIKIIIEIYDILVFEMLMKYILYYIPIL